MKKAKRPASTLFTLISVAAVIIVMIFVTRSQQSNKEKEKSLEKLSEVDKMLEMNLDEEYPQTPREVAELHGNMTRLLYSGLKDEEIAGLAIMIRDLYDEELIEINPEEQYLKDLYSDIALWQQLDRRIEYSIIVNDNQEEIYSQDGRDYATAFVSFTITEKGKTSRRRHYLMRKDKEGRWKILGWEEISKE